MKTEEYVPTTAFDALIGKKIVSVSTDSRSITFRTDEGVLEADAAGSCCSHSWFEHISDTGAIVGEVVTQIHEYSSGLLDLHEHTDFCVNQCENEDAAAAADGRLKAYSWRIQTARGGLDLEMRNSSNGYYGGYVESRWAENPKGR